MTDPICMICGQSIKHMHKPECIERRLAVIVARSSDGFEAERVAQAMKMREQD